MGGIIMLAELIIQAMAANSGCGFQQDLFDNNLVRVEFECNKIGQISYSNGLFTAVSDFMPRNRNKCINGTFEASYNFLKACYAREKRVNTSNTQQLQLIF